MTADRPEPSQAARRKDEHIELASSQSPATVNDFDDIELVHHALDGVNVERVHLDTSIDGWRWPVPLFINGMTGGSPAAERINRALAVAAREHGIPVASGSLGVALDEPDTARTFRVLRDENPAGIVIANLGAGRSADEALRAVELLEADALQVHLNAVQETVMPEGARDFSGWAGLIESIAAASPVPVIVKEVGFGLSRRTLQRLRDLGVRVADVAGRGGTDFARIENDRRDVGDFAYLAGYGQSAVECLLEGRGMLPALLASGGVRTPLDAVRALALGADAVGVAGVFLRAAMQSEERAVEVIGAWRLQLAQLLAMLGAETVAELTSLDLLVRGRTREFCELRGIDPTRRGAPEAPSARGEL